MGGANNAEDGGGGAGGAVAAVAKQAVLAKATAASSTDGSGGEGSGNTGMIVGVVLTVLVCTFAVIAVILFYRRKRSASHDLTAAPAVVFSGAFDDPRLGAPSYDSVVPPSDTYASIDDDQGAAPSCRCCHRVQIPVRARITTPVSCGSDAPVSALADIGSPSFCS